MPKEPKHYVLEPIKLSLKRETVKVKKGLELPPLVSGEVSGIGYSASSAMQTSFSNINLTRTDVS